MFLDPLRQRLNGAEHALSALVQVNVRGDRVFPSADLLLTGCREQICVGHVQLCLVPDFIGLVGPSGNVLQYLANNGPNDLEPHRFVVV